MPMLAMSKAFAPVIALTPLIPVSKVAKDRPVIFVQLPSSDAVRESPSRRHTSPTYVGTPMTCQRGRIYLAHAEITVEMS